MEREARAARWKPTRTGQRTPVWVPPGWLRARCGGDSPASQGQGTGRRGGDEARERAGRVQPLNTAGPRRVSSPVTPTQSLKL